MSDRMQVHGENMVNWLKLLQLAIYLFDTI